MLFICLCCCHSYRNHFFHLYQQNKSCKSKGKLNQASKCCKKVFESAKLVYANKTKESITSKKIGLLIDEFLVFPTKVNLLYLIYSTTWRCCLLHLIKQICLLKTILRTLILIIWVYYYLLSILELI